MSTGRRLPQDRRNGRQLITLIRGNLSRKTDTGQARKKCLLPAGRQVTILSKEHFISKNNRLVSIFYGLWYKFSEFTTWKALLH